MSESTILILNACVYTLTSLFLIKKHTFKNIGVFLSLLYTISSWISVLYLNNSLFDISIVAPYLSIRFEPLIYLYIIDMMIILPFTKYKISKINVHTHLNWKLIKLIVLILTIGYSIVLLSDLPVLFKSFSGNVNLGDMRQSTYSEGAINNRSFIINVFSRFINGFKLIYFFLSVYGILFSIKSKKFFWFSLLFYIFTIFVGTLQNISRALLIHLIFDLLIAYLIFYQNINKKIRKKIINYSVLSVFILGSFFWSVTLSRFGDSGNNKNNAILYSLERYAGESTINFSSFLYDNTKEPTLGYSLFPIFRRIVGLDYKGGLDKDIAIQYMDKRINAPSYIFYQLSGALYIAFGKWGALIIALLFNLLMRRLMISKSNYYFFKLFVVLLLASIVAKGLFWATFGNESGNLSFVFTIILYFYFKKNYGIKVIKPHKFSIST